MRVSKSFPRVARTALPCLPACFLALTLAAPPSGPSRADAAGGGRADGVRGALRQGAAWLASRQRPDGGWSDFHRPDEVSGVGVSALVTRVLAGLPAEIRDGKLDVSIDRGLDFLLARRGDDGSVKGDGVIGYRSYSSALLLAALNLRGGAEHRDARTALASFLVDSQLDEGEDVPPYDWHYGSWNYYDRTDTGTVRVDISVHAYCLDALRAPDLDVDAGVFAKARRFTHRTQNFLEGRSAAGSVGGTAAGDGGFAFSPRVSKAGRTEVDGTTVFRSYGSATVDGLRSLLALRYPDDDERIRAARAWLASHWTLDRNPGIPENDPIGMDQAVRFYYYAGLGGVIDAPGRVRELADRTMEDMAEGGRWTNPLDAMAEDHPEVATAFAVWCLAELLPKLE